MHTILLSWHAFSQQRQCLQAMLAMALWDSLNY